jgi:hypothetical protein
VNFELTNETNKFGMHNEILHYDLSKDNIMLHFPPNKLDVVYIGVCVWGTTTKCVLIHFSFHYILSEFRHFHLLKLFNPLVNGDQLLRTN